MNQVAQSAVNCVAHTAAHHQGSAATRKRPEKSLRNSDGCAGNLIVFSHQQTPAIPMCTGHTEPDLPAQQASAASSAISQQVLASCAANHDQRDLSGCEPLPATKLLNSGLRPSTFVKAFAGLAVIAVGVTWVAAKSATPEPEATSEPAILEPAAGGQASSGADIPMPSAETTYARPEEDYLEELDWLEDQNRFLQAEVEMLTTETLELNRELLDMELQLAIQSQIVEPSTEKRIVYNFVDVPVGTKLGSITENSESESYEPLHLTDKVLSYDPDTGFHLNGQFNGASDAYIEGISISSAAEQTQTPEKITYPPIASTPSK